MRRRFRKGEKQSQSHQLIQFELGDISLGFKINDVKEIIYQYSLQLLPDSYPFIEGITTIKGNTSIVLNLGRKFNLPNAERFLDEKGYLILLKNENTNVAVCLSTLPNSIKYYDNEVDRSPEIMEGLDINESFVNAVLNREEALTIVLDMQKIIEYPQIVELDKALKSSSK